MHLKKLLDFIDAIAEGNEVDFSLKEMRQLANIGKVTGMLNYQEQPHPGLAAFIDAWNEADIYSMNAYLGRYEPYLRLLEMLKTHKQIPLPKRETLSGDFKNLFGISKSRVRDYRHWAECLGQAHVYGHVLHWQGIDSVSIPQTDFTYALKSAYASARKTTGYANLGEVAIKVCRTLEISYKGFCDCLARYNCHCAREDNVKFAPATIRRDTRNFTSVPLIRPRRDIVKNRLKAKLLQTSVSPQEERWFSYRFFEDGVHLNGNLVKLIRFH